MLNLKNGDIISLQELKKSLDISQPTWQRRKDKILQDMGDFYDYTIKEEQGKQTLIIINEVYNENCQYYYSRKGNEKADKAKGILWDYIIEKVEAKQLISGAQIGRHFKKIDRKKEFEDFSEQWIARQVAKMLKLNYQNNFTKTEGVVGSVIDNILVTLDKVSNKYIPLTEEEKDFFFSNMNQKLNEEWSQKIISTIYCEDSPLSEEEKLELKGKVLDFSWERAKNVFAEKYGAIPFVIKQYANDKEKIVLVNDLPDWFVQKISKS